MVLPRACRTRVSRPPSGSRTDGDALMKQAPGRRAISGSSCERCVAGALENKDQAAARAISKPSTPTQSTRPIAHCPTPPLQFSHHSTLRGCKQRSRRWAQASPVCPSFSVPGLVRSRIRQCPRRDCCVVLLPSLVSAESQLHIQLVMCLMVTRCIKRYSE
jgi:hypothetical protein